MDDDWDKETFCETAQSECPHFGRALAERDSARRRIAELEAEVERLRAQYSELREEVVREVAGAANRLALICERHNKEDGDEQTAENP
jgi:F0F1-type ATP synthase membrane subunit b/b'